MRFVDRLLQFWRIAQAARFIPSGARLLDVGCADGALFRALGSRLAEGLGLDPALTSEAERSATEERDDGPEPRTEGRGSMRPPRPSFRLMRGTFPEAAPAQTGFDVITALAVLEHVPELELGRFAAGCAERLAPSGRLILTVPSPRVDALLRVLKRLRLIDGQALEQHHGFDPARTPALFQAVGLRLAHHHRFQLGLNHLFVFEKPDAAGVSGEQRPGLSGPPMPPMTATDRPWLMAVPRSLLSVGASLRWPVEIHHLVSGAVLSVALVVAGWRNLTMLNTDAVAYLRLASYYANGQTDLMISGYWGPLLSWLIAPWLRLGVDALVAGRIVMAWSGLVFWWGCVGLFGAVGLPERGRILGTWAVVLATVYWSVRFLTPDLLVSGLTCAALATMLGGGWCANRTKAVRAGALWGVAYLAKAVALPLAVLDGAVITMLWWTRLKELGRSVEDESATPEVHGSSASAIGPDKRRPASSGQARQREDREGQTALPAGTSVGHRGEPWLAVRQLLLTWLVCALVAAPWIVVLSLKYQAPTFSTSAGIAHAVAGPPDVARYHPALRTLHRPPPGRVTAWEDPDPGAYAYWSPFAGADAFWHQVKLVARNMAIAVWLMTKLVALAPGLLALAGLALCRGGRRRRRWPWLIAPLGCLSAVYLPVFLHPGDERYFYGAFPLLWGIGFGLLTDWPARGARVQARLERWGLRLLILVFLVFPALLTVLALVGLPKLAPAGDCARELAARLEHAQVRGPIAGSARLTGGRTGLYTAFFLRQPWLGDEESPTPESYFRSGARLVVVVRESALAQQLRQDSRFRDLDAVLFASPAEAARCAVQVFERVERVD